MRTSWEHMIISHNDFLPYFFSNVLNFNFVVLFITSYHIYFIFATQYVILKRYVLMTFVKGKRQGCTSSPTLLKIYGKMYGRCGKVNADEWVTRYIR